MNDQLLQQILALDPKEQAHIVEEVWGNLLRDHPDAAPVTPAQRDELDRRLERYRDEPHPGTPANEVHDRLRAKIAK